MRAGRGLRAGRSVHVVARTGSARLPELAFCGDLPRRSLAWRLYPERELWRPPAGDLLPSDPSVLSVPALADPRAVWLRSPSRRTFSAWAAHAGLALDALLRYNGVAPAPGLASKRPVGPLALPPS